MSDPKPPKATKHIAVTVEAWERARQMAGLRTAKDQGGDAIGAVATDAIMLFWDRLPEEVRRFLDEPHSIETEAA